MIAFGKFLENNTESQPLHTIMHPQKLVCIKWHSGQKEKTACRAKQYLQLTYLVVCLEYVRTATDSN